jgi:secondary thiamine-phosphate synthase enzyme
MKVHTEYLKFHTRKHREYIHITPQIEGIVKNSGVKDGMVLVSAMHITAGVYVNDNEYGLIEDIDQWLEQLAPFRKGYKHHDTGEDNGDSHLKALLIIMRSSSPSRPVGSISAPGSGFFTPNSTASGTSG